MGELGGGECLWGPEGLTDGEDYGLSAGLRRDLAAFGERWEANVTRSVTDDRRGGSRRPRAGRVARAEDDELRRLGERLAQRVQAEVGPDYVVTYQH